MTDDICGYETAAGTPCQHPTTDDGDADRCWIDDHNEADTESDDPGRPTKFTDERARAAVAAARKSKSVRGCERAAGVAKGTIKSWLDAGYTYTDETGEEQEFFPAFTSARADGETVLVHGGLRDENVDTSMAKFLLATSFDYVKKEEREISGGEDIGKNAGWSNEDLERFEEALDTDPGT
jgi:hypothetical protein